MKFFLKAALIFLVTGGICFAQNLAESPDFKAENVEVMVVGSYHLRQLDFNETPVAVNLIAHSLMKYKPDHIVVE